MVWQNLFSFSVRACIFPVRIVKLYFTVMQYCTSFHIISNKIKPALRTVSYNYKITDCIIRYVVHEFRIMNVIDAFTQAIKWLRSWKEKKLKTSKAIVYWANQNNTVRELNHTCRNAFFIHDSFEYKSVESFIELYVHILLHVLCFHFFWTNYFSLTVSNERKHFFT